MDGRTDARTYVRTDGQTSRPALLGRSTRRSRRRREVDLKCTGKSRQALLSSVGAAAGKLSCNSSVSIIVGEKLSGLTPILQ